MTNDDVERNPVTGNPVGTDTEAAPSMEELVEAQGQREGMSTVSISDVEDAQFRRILARAQRQRHIKVEAQRMAGTMTRIERRQLSAKGNPRLVWDSKEKGTYASEKGTAKAMAWQRAETDSPRQYKKWKKQIRWLTAMSKKYANKQLGPLTVTDADRTFT